MYKKLKIPFALAILSAALMGCSSNKVKEEKVKPNPLPKLVQSNTLVPVFSLSVSSTDQADPLRLNLGADQGKIFAIDPKGSVIAYQGNKRVWEKRVSKQGLSSGVEAAEGVVIVGNHKGQVFALDQATGELKWQAQTTGALISPALIQSGRVIIVSNEGTVFAFDLNSGQQAWTYKLPSVQFSLRGQASPISIDQRTIAVGTANGYIYAIDSLTGVLRMQRRVAISEGRSDIQRLIGIQGEPVMSERFLISTSYQGQVTALDLSNQTVAWSQGISSLFGPAVTDNKVIVSSTDGKLVAYDSMTGQVVWENDQLLHRNLSNPVVFGAYIVVGDMDGVIHLFDPSSGQLVGRAKSSGDVRSLRVVDGQLFVGTGKGKLSIWQVR